MDLFPDADFGGCQATSKSTSGCYQCLTGPNTRFGLSGLSKAQSVVSHLTPEAEIVAADFGLRTVGLPSLTLWKTLIGWKRKEVIITVHDDNAAMIQVMRTGKNPTMRGLGNTHGVSINRLKEAFDENWNDLVKEDTNTMAGDIFTKAFESRDKWTHACSLINIFDANLIKHVPRVAGGGANRSKDRFKGKQRVQREEHT